MVEKVIKVSTIGRDGGSTPVPVDTEESWTYTGILQEADLAIGADTKLYSDEGLIDNPDQLVDLNKVGTIAVSAPKIAGGMYPEEVNDDITEEAYRPPEDEEENEEDEETMEPEDEYAIAESDTGEDEEMEMEIPPEMQKTIKVSTIGRDGGSVPVTVHKEASVTYNYVLQQADLAVGAETKVYSDEGLINNPDSLVDLGKVSTIAVSAPKIAGGVN